MAWHSPQKNVRIKVDLQEYCAINDRIVGISWYFVDKKYITTIGDLQRDVISKYVQDATDKWDTPKLTMDGCLLPEWASINLLRENETVRFNISKTENKRKTSKKSKKKEKKKRQRDEDVNNKHRKSKSKKRKLEVSSDEELDLAHKKERKDQDKGVVMPDKNDHGSAVSSTQQHIAKSKTTSDKKKSSNLVSAKQKASLTTSSSDTSESDSEDDDSAKMVGKPSTSGYKDKGLKKKGTVTQDSSDESDSISDSDMDVDEGGIEMKGSGKVSIIEMEAQKFREATENGMIITKDTVDSEGTLKPSWDNEGVKERGSLKKTSKDKEERSCELDSKDKVMESNRKKGNVENATAAIEKVGLPMDNFGNDKGRGMPSGIDKNTDRIEEGFGKENLEAEGNLEAGEQSKKKKRRRSNRSRKKKNLNNQSLTTTESADKHAPMTTGTNNFRFNFVDANDKDIVSVSAVDKSTSGNGYRGDAQDWNQQKQMGKTRGHWTKKNVRNNQHQNHIKFGSDEEENGKDSVKGGRNGDDIIKETLTSEKGGSLMENDGTVRSEVSSILAHQDSTSGYTEDTSAMAIDSPNQDSLHHVQMVKSKYHNSPSAVITSTPVHNEFQGHRMGMGMPCESNGKGDAVMGKPCESSLIRSKCELLSGAQVFTRTRHKKKGNFSLTKAQAISDQVTNKSFVFENTEDGEVIKKQKNVRNPGQQDKDKDSTVTEKPVVQTKDYSSMPPLYGPPRSGDRIAYKVLEMSDNYCPEVSAFKEAVVTSFDPQTQMVGLKLTAQIETKKQGRFDIVVEDGDSILTNKPTHTSVQVNLTSMLETRLVTDDTT